MRALFAYDLLGFQSHDDVEHFSRYVQGEAGAEPMGEYRFRAFHRTVRAQAFPIGIDVDEFIELGRADEARDLRDDARPVRATRLLLGIDRLDYSKGLPQRLKAFRRCWLSTPRTVQAPR
jgi:trehalose 6-phosphate synthase